MKTSVGKLKQSSSPANSIALVNKQFRTGFEIPLLPYQTNGIICRVLWPTKNHVIRIIPGYNPETGEILRQNENCDVYSDDAELMQYLSDTFIEARVCERFRENRYPFITDYRPGTPDADLWAGETVLHNFIKDIIYACREDGKGRNGLVPTNEWKAWTAYGRDCQLDFDRPSLLMQALVFKLNDKNNQDLESKTDLVDEDGDIKPLLACVAISHKASIAKLEQALVLPANRSKPLDSVENNSLGPMAELEGNKLFLNSCTEMTGGKQASVLKPSVQESPTGWTPTPFFLDEEACKQLWHPWEELLYYMDAQEQLKFCANAFGADTVNYVIGNCRNLQGLEIPSDIKAAGLGRYANVNMQGSVSFTVSPHASPAASKPALGKGLAAAAANAPSSPAGTLGKPKLSGLQHTSTLDMDKIQATVESIRKASAKESAQADEAADLLGLEGGEL